MLPTIAELSKLYQNAPEAVLSPDQRRAYQRFNHEMYRAWVTPGLKIRYVDYDPYPDFATMRRLVEATGTLEVTTCHNDSRLLPGQHNLWGRTWHDLLHLWLEADFSMAGECEVARAVLRCFIGPHHDPIIAKLVFSEIVLEVATALDRGCFYPVQRVVLVPDRLLEEFTCSEEVPA
jgi:hypothetical protein